MNDITQLAKATLEEWKEDPNNHHAAAVAFFAMVAFVALLIFSVAVGGTFLADQEVQQNITQYVQETSGAGSAEIVNQLLEGTYNNEGSNGGTLAAIISIATVLFLASYLYIHLRKSMNDIWEAETPENKDISDIIQERVFAAVAVVLGMSLVVAALMLQFFMPAVLSEAGIEGVASGFVTALTAIGVFIILTILSALIYRFVPDSDIAWSDVWIGALVTAMLIMIGQVLILIYLSVSTVTSAYGILGATLAILLWVYYSAHSLLLGAEFTYVYSFLYGSRIEQKADFELRSPAFSGGIAAQT